jgi:hypothetical protein
MMQWLGTTLIGMIQIFHALRSIAVKVVQLSLLYAQIVIIKIRLDKAHALNVLQAMLAEVEL